MHKYKKHKVQFKTLNFASLVNKVTWVIFMSLLKKALKINSVAVTSEHHFPTEVFTAEGCKVSRS